MVKNFEETVMYKKGKLGECLIDKKILSADKFIPYAPVGDCAHPFDRICASKDKKKLMVLEVKTISARQKYPDTGISIKHYYEYLHIQDKYQLPVYIAFVDGYLRKIYGNKLDELRKPIEIVHKGKTISYPKIEENFTAVGGKIIYFPLLNMTTIHELADDEAEELERYSNYGYKRDLSHKKGYNKWLEKREELSSYYSY